MSLFADAAPVVAGSPGPAATGDDPVVVGLDLSLTATGYAGPDGTRRFVSEGHKGDTLAQRAARLRSLSSEIFSATAVQTPSLVVIEAPSFGSTGGSAHDRSGLWWLVVAELGHPLVKLPAVNRTALDKLPRPALRGAA